MVTVAREELHQLVDQLDEDKVLLCCCAARQLAALRDGSRSRPSWFGALHAGPDFAERSEDILRAELGRSA